MRTLFNTLLFAIALAPLSAQQRFTTNSQMSQRQILTPRQLNYWPEDGDYVTRNGKNRFTRALYGGNTAFRLETSDGLEFGLFMPNMGGNVTMTFHEGTHEIKHYETETRYRAGQRIYRVELPADCSASAGNPAVVNIVAVALYEGEGAIWKIESQNVKPTVSLHARYGAATNAGFSRNGDMGVDKKDCFDFKPERCEGNVYTLKDHSFLLHYGQKSRKGDCWMQGFWSEGIQVEPSCCGGDRNRPYLTFTLNLSTQEPQYLEIASGTGLLATSLPRQYEAALDSAKTIASSLQIETPDPVFNTLGWTVAMAADGTWDEQEGVWMHGAIGWRNALPGWRAAYMGDVLGWHRRARIHFVNYAQSQLTDIDIDPSIPVQDASKNLARGTEKIGTPIFSTGYICRYPRNRTKINHYDMNLVYIDELLWHLQWVRDPKAYQAFWPVLQRHLAWEKRNFDPNDDGLYDAYCCIWASDALYYNGGAVTHSSAYNYRANRLAADIATLYSMEQDARRYAAEAEKTLSAINDRLWMEDEGMWAEFQDEMGLKRLHRSPALWSFYHSLDSDIADSIQAHRAARWVMTHMPHYPILVNQDSACGQPLSQMPEGCRTLVETIANGNFANIATTNWQPYAWSINNVAVGETAHTALAYYQAGEGEAGFRLLKSQLLDGMYLGGSPGNIGQISYYDAARGECYRDFADPIGILARTVVQGMFGVNPDAIHNRINVRPQVPAAWPNAGIETSDFRLTMQKVGEEQEWTLQTKSYFTLMDTVILCGKRFLKNAEGKYTARIMPKREKQEDVASRRTATVKSRKNANPAYRHPIDKRLDPVDLGQYYNLELSQLFAQRYLSPRYPHATLAIPVQGLGEWCAPKDTFEIHDEGLRRVQGIPQGKNVVFTSLWDNFPTSVEIPLEGKARKLHLLMAGTTNWMQCRIANAVLRVNYTDGSQDSLILENPTNWWPIEQELLQGLPSYYLSSEDNDMQAPFRMSLRTGEIYRPQAAKLNQKTDGGAANLIAIPLNPKKSLRSLTLETLSNDVVIGILKADLERR